MSTYIALCQLLAMWVLQTKKVLRIWIRHSLRPRNYPFLLLICILAGTFISLLRVSSITICGAAEPHQQVPFRHIPRKDGHTLFPFTQSKDMIVRAAYFDDRPRNGHTNITVFMLQARRDIVGKMNKSLLLGCGVGKHVATPGHYEIRPCGSIILHSWIHKHFPHLTHDEVMLDCFDLPAQNGSTAFIIYKPDINSSSARIAHSELPFLIPAPPQPRQSQDYDFKILSCVNIFGTPNWLVEWLHYQKAIGVDHVHITIQDSVLKSHERSYLRQAVREGFVTVDEWQQWFNDSEIYYHSQTLAYADCIYRYRGTYDYAFILDTDDFFVPMNPGQKRLHYYVNKWCKDSASCAFSWIEYYPDCGLKGEPGSDGNMTKVLNSTVHVDRDVGKSLHKLSVVMDTGVHQAESVIMKARSFDVKYHHGIVKIPDDEAYVAHIRKNKKPPNGRCE